MSNELKLPFSIYRESGEGRIVNARCNKSAMEIVEVTGGKVKVQVGTDFVIAQRGDIFYVPPGVMLRIDAAEGIGQVRGIIFDSSVFEENMENFDTEVFLMFRIQSKNKLTVFGESHPVHNVLARLIGECMDEYSLRDVCYKLPIRANIYLMLTYLLRYFTAARNEQDRMVYHNVLRLAPVLNYIEESFREKIYIEKLAAMINVSADYFTKMFKESIGKTPIDYINAMRINYAMDLLTSTEMQMSEIADIIGFCNPNYFHKIFKQYIEISPLAYRKNSK